MYPHIPPNPNPRYNQSYGQYQNHGPHSQYPHQWGPQQQRGAPKSGEGSQSPPSGEEPNDDTIYYP